MTNPTRIHNFSAGPAVLPLTVVEQLREQLPNLEGSGLGLMEISHRSATFDAIVQSAKARLRRVLSIPDDYEVLLLQGGASLQFCMLAMNLLRGDKADYLDTGTWSKKAVTEAKYFGEPRVAWSGADSGYNSLPGDGDWECAPEAVYTHFTSNNTISGTQFQRVPKGNHLVCDMSSDIASRPMEASEYDLIYAGAQKNLGPSGVTVVVLSPWAIERSDPNLPSMLRYRLQVEKQSLFNTPNTLGVFVLERVLAWVDDQGLDNLATTNERKAQKIYSLLDSSDFWRPHAANNVRSRMNVTWRLVDSDLEPVMVAEALEVGLSGIKGHRSVGGLRASIYNACPEASVDTLVDFLVEFERRKG